MSKLANNNQMRAVLATVGAFLLGLTTAWFAFTLRVDSNDVPSSRHAPRTCSHPFADDLTSACSSGGNSLLPYNATLDQTAKVQQALSEMGAAGGGVVNLPAGCFYFNGQLNVPSGVTLRGSYAAVPSHDNVSQPILFDGTFLLPIADHGNEDGQPFISLVGNSGLQGVVVYYPRQNQIDIPVPYPWCVSMRGNNAFVLDVELLNPFLGISAVQAHRHYIARVQGQPFKIGIYVDQTYDIGRIENVHFNPWFSPHHPLIEYQLVHGRAFVFGRSDWEYVFNTFAFGYAIGYHFIHTDSGDMNGNFVGIGADLAINASVLVEAAQAPGILITNGEFTSFHNDDWLPGSSVKSSHVIVTSSNSGPVQFVSSSFWGPSTSVAEIRGSGTVSFSACQFVEWAEQGDPNVAAINVHGGNAIIQNSNFQKDAAQLNMDGANKVVFVGNLGTGALRVTGQAAVFQESSNAFV